ncbi:MAG: hypothetical protein JSV03_07165, partial [Planctomycetota bacterium]
NGFDNISFIGEYPIATIKYGLKDQSQLPVSVSAEVFSPFIPLNTRDSANPATVLRFTVANTSEETVNVSLAAWLQNAVCLGLQDEAPSHSRNRVVQHKGMTSLILDTAQSPELARRAEFGNMALTSLYTEVTATATFPSLKSLLDDLDDDGQLNGPLNVEFPLGQKHCGALATDFQLKPGKTEEVPFILTWYFPNRRQGNKGVRIGDRCCVGPRVGNMYANWFKSSLEVAEYISGNFPRLNHETHLFRDTYFDTTLPYWFVHRIAMPVSNLATETCQWWANGRFWGWEGVGCCFGTCGHVWHYDQATGRLFPELMRSVREMQDFNPEEGFDADKGRIAFRGRGGKPAGDSQAAYVLMAYREHLMSANDDFLQRNWPKIRKALECMIRWDDNRDGLIEGIQHNTYDINFHGANTMIGSLYLAALRAGEEMAVRMDDTAFADDCRKICESGGKLSVGELFNGQYFIQKVDLKRYPKYQYGDGCLSDQLIGQGWAHQLGLGYVYPKEHVVKALQSVWTYNWAPDVGPHNRVHKPEIIFADPGEAGLFLCTWPRGNHPGYNGVRYRNTIWTGIEAQVAGHMLYEGMLTEGLAIMRGIHERYDGVKHNPWNQILCGDHYARAMASWGCLIAVSAYIYDGPAGKIGFAPRFKPEDFKAFFTAAEGWGSLVQKRNGNSQTNRIELKWGKLRVKTMVFEVPGGVQPVKVTITVGSEQFGFDWTVDDQVIMLELEQPVIVTSGSSVEVVLTW